MDNKTTLREYIFKKEIDIYGDFTPENTLLRMIFSPPEYCNCLRRALHEVEIVRQYRERVKEYKRLRIPPYMWFKKFLSRPEIKIAKVLYNLGLDYISQYPIKNLVKECDHRFTVDFYLPNNNLVIECDGVFWHSRPKKIKRDNYVNGILQCNNINVLRLTDTEINEHIVKCRNRIKKYLT